jgi:hypothetical protein
MTSFSYLTVMFAPAKRTMAMTAVIGTVMLASPLVPARAQTNTPVAQSNPPAGQSSTPAPARQTRAQRKAETIDQRIAALHSELKITPAEESNWQAVAQTMRDNAAAIEKLAADRASQQNVTAIDDLQEYQKFAQAHVDGLTKLISTFQTLYNAMPDQQKKLSDQVFQHPKH